MQLVTDLRWCTYTCKVLAEQRQCVIVVEFIVYSLMRFFFLTRELEGDILLAIGSAIRAKPSWFYVSHECFLLLLVELLSRRASGMSLVNSSRYSCEPNENPATGQIFADLNTLANTGYKHNFARTHKHLHKIIAALSGCTYSLFRRTITKKTLCDLRSWPVNRPREPRCCTYLLLCFLVFRCKMKWFFKHWNALLPC